MSQEWIIDVLVDLRQYAIRNYHMGLAEQLDDAIVVAAVELRAAAALDAEEAAAAAAPPLRLVSGAEAPMLTI